MSTAKPSVSIEESEPMTGSTAQQELVLQPLESHTTNTSDTIIVKLIPQNALTRSSKLRSLLPKTLFNHVSGKSEGSISFQELPHADIEQEIVNSIAFSEAEIVPSFSVKSVTTQMSQSPTLLNTNLDGSEGIDTIFKQFNSMSSSTVAVSEDMESTIIVQIPKEKATTKHKTSTTEPQFSQTTSSLLAKSVVDTLLTSSHLGKETVEELGITASQEKESDVIKKTMVEAFVKMVVCRKVTVETVDTKTGEVLDTQVKMEEEEPVILGVECVETTEDLVDSSFASSYATKSKVVPANGDLASSKWGSSLDGGLKFLSAVSESRQKITKSLIKDKFLKSTKVVPQNRVAEAESEVSKTALVKTEVIDEREESKENSEADLNDSDDFIPNSSKSTFRKSIIATRSNREKIYKTGGIDQIVLLPKKRGRKRKWCNALGLASNLRTCQFCNKQFSSVSSCSKHMKKGTCVSSVYCFICSKSLQNEEELEVHLVSHTQEPKTGMFQCEDCHRSYRTRSGFVKHFRQGTCQRRHELEDGFPGDFQCDLCDSSFSTHEYLQLHRYKVHENPLDRHDCPDCGKKFYSSQGYHKHRTSGRSCTELLKCHICGKSYSNKARESFKIHMKHHKSEVSGITFNCEECGRSYMTQVALNKHKLSHTGVKPYKCEVCGKEFSMRYMVKDHARMHTGERPYLCNLCGSAFSNKGHLGRHLRSHDNGTLLKRGRPKKIKDRDEITTQESELKMIDIRETLQRFHGHSIQVVNGQMFDSHANGTPMIIQADNNTIIIAEGWPDSAGSSHPVSVHNAQDIVNVTTASIMPSTNT